MKTEAYLFLFFIGMGCYSEDSNYPSHQPGGSVEENLLEEINDGIHSDFQKYVESFRYEAKLRSLEFDFSHLNVQYGNLEIHPGVCSLGDTSVRIQKTYWDRVDDCQRERLIFHELGHCILRRSHKNDTLNAQWLSIMRGQGIGYPKDGLESLNYTDVYSRYYVDELFDEYTPLSPFLFNVKPNLSEWLTAEELLYNFTSEFDSITFNLDMNQKEFHIKISFEEQIEHNPIVLTPDGSTYIESIKLASKDKNHIFDLLFGQLIVEDSIDCDLYSNAFDKPVNSISIINQGEFALIFIDERYEYTSSRLHAGQFTIRTELSKGIEDISVYAL